MLVLGSSAPVIMPCHASTFAVVAGPRSFDDNVRDIKFSTALTSALAQSSVVHDLSILESFSSITLWTAPSVTIPEASP